jgi:hypothetical protein
LVVALVAFAAGWVVSRPALVSIAAPDLSEEVVVALDQDSAFERYSLLIPCLRKMSAGNFEPVVAAYESRLSLLDEMDLVLLASRWAEFDPAGAFWRISDWPRRIEQRHALAEVVRHWASTAPHDALAAIENLAIEDAELYAAVHRALVTGWVQSPDVLGVTAYVATLDQPSARQTLATRIAEERMRDGGIEAIEGWVERISPDAPDRFKLVAFRKAVRVIALTDPAAAIEWLARHAGQDYTDGADRIIATVWASSEPIRALEWTLGLPAGEDRDRALRYAFDRWAGYDPDASTRWLEAHVGEASVDPAITAQISRLRHSDPRGAIEWATHLSNEASRHEAWVDVASLWVRSEPQEAEAWIRSADLPPNVAAAIRSDAGASRIRRRGPRASPGEIPRMEGAASPQAQGSQG